MIQIIEIINYQENLPINVSIESADNSKYNWFKQLSIVFVLKGKIRIEIDGVQHILQEKDMFIINQKTFYIMEGLEENKVCIMHVEPEHFEEEFDGFINLKFKANPAMVPTEQDHIKFLFGQIIITVYKRENGYILRAKKFLYDLIFALINSYIDDKSSSEEELKQEKRLKVIIEYIMEHYMEKITLNDIAHYVHLNSQYISRYFSKRMGLTLSEFIYNIRLQESLKDLNDSNKKIIYIALENGFPNSKSYFKAFKNKYNITPMAFRKKYCMSGDINSDRLLSELIANKTLGSIFECLNFSEVTFKRSLVIPQIKEDYTIDYNKSEGYLNKSWMKLTGFGRASDGLKAEWRNQLLKLQKEIPFEYIRLQGILCDDLRLYREDSNGNVSYNFSYIDELIVFLLEANIKPFIELGFMPEKLSSNEHTAYTWGANVGYPKDITKWNNLIENLIRHLILRYGSREVRTWYFQIWNELCFDNPDIDKSMTLLENTYKTIKSVDSKLRVGGLNIIREVILATDLLDKINNFCIKKEIVLDFMSFNIYSILASEDELKKGQWKERFNGNRGYYFPEDSLKECMYGDENFITRNIDEVLKKLKDYTFFKDEIFITEWNISPYPKELLHDTCFKAAFLVKNILDNYDKVSGMAYWMFADIFEEVKAGTSIFHGGTGFITANGLKKPIYYAFQLLNKLGSELVKKGTDYIATKKSDGSFQIILYNYCHFYNPYIKYINDKVTVSERYEIFNDRIKNICFNLIGFKGKAIKRKYIINRVNGSVFDQWVNIGSPLNLTSEEKKYLEMKSIYKYSTDLINCDNEFIITEQLMPHEVMLIEINPI